ncbi:MAG: winged helix-turn-helix transcriptional regulator [Spirochaetes bacterium]|nr:winged helix-turn-helix transcriptional regulator [Spirochaetota bacterium]
MYYDQIVSKLRKQFKLNEAAVKKILKEFIDRNMIIVGVEDKMSLNILANKVRNQIYQLIEKYPGIYSNFLKKHLSLGSRQLLWHLAFLLEFNEIYSCSFGKIHAFGVADIQKINILIGFVMLKSNLRDILKLLVIRDEGLNQYELLKRLNIPKSTVNYALKKLIKRRIIEVKFDSTDETKIYYLSFDSASIVQNSITQCKQLFSIII